jgi:CubicO group peptidase (beta-lactamase class C family)
LKFVEAHSRLAVIVAGCLLLVAPTQAAQPSEAAVIDAFLHDALRAWRVPGVALAVVRDDRVIYLKGAGVKTIGTDESITADTLFPISSCTKAFTTTAMALLVDEGKMTWDDAVRRHVSFFHLADPLADANVTLRDLVTHRIGLGGNDLLWYRSPFSRDDIIRRIGHVRLKHPFRSTFQYQSTMFSTAGVAVESASGCKWEEFIARHLFRPLGITQAVFTSTAAERAPDHATPHRPNDRGEPQPISWYPLTSPDPAGSIHISARDLARWVRFQLGDGTFAGKRLVSARNLAETHTPQIVIRLEGNARDMNPDTLQMSYGMGWVIQDYRGHLLWSHAGAIDGFRAHVALVPDSKLGIVLLNNLHNTSMNLAVSNQLVDYFLGLPRKDWNSYLISQVRKQDEAAAARLRERRAKRQPGTMPSHDLVAYAGTYEDAAYGTATVSLENEVLVWNWSSFRGELEHYHYDTFTLANDMIGRPQVMFRLDRDGRVAAMQILDTLEVEFKKTKPGPNGSRR